MIRDSSLPGGPEDGDPRVAECLDAARPVPDAGFRGALGRYLVGQDPGYGPRPLRLRLVSAAFLTGSAIVLAVAALQATGTI